MNLYHVMIDIHDDAKALVFAKALDEWLTYLKDAGKIGEWRLMRRKLGLASGEQRDFLLEIELDGLGQLDEAFRHASAHSGRGGRAPGTAEGRPQFEPPAAARALSISFASFLPEDLQIIERTFFSTPWAIW